MATQSAPATGNQQQQQQQPPQPPQRPGPNDQADGDLADWVRNFDAMIPAGAHASFPRVWASVGEHEMFAKMSTGIDTVREKLSTASKLNDEIASELKAHANKAYSERKFNAAVAMYTRALLYAQSPKTLAVLACNRSAVTLEQGLPLAALSDAQYALEHDPSYTTALARRGKCLRQLGRPEWSDRDVAAADGKGEPVPSHEVRSMLDAAMAEKPVEASDNSALVTPPNSIAGSNALVASGVWAEGPKDGEKGRHVAVESAAKAGTTVLVEYPFVSVVRPEGLLCCCAHCHRQTTCLYPCLNHVKRGLRSRGLFCSAACADAAWTLHGEVGVCEPLLAGVPSRSPPSTTPRRPRRGCF
jgi:tetratricopeptide (TPR) repeat protein